MPNKNILFRTDIARGGAVRVDRDREVINGFAVVTKGVTHDERGEFDDQALETVIEFGNKSKIGIKSRFGHPNMSGTALGTFLGRTKNFRRDGDIVRADLHIDKTAHNTPDGDLATYVMNLAESDPDAFGSSMVIRWDEEYRDEQDDIPPLIRVKKLSSVDIVDDPAANSGFFSDSVKPSAEMTMFLDELLQQPEAVEKVISFLEKYRVNRENLNKKKEPKIMNEDLTVTKLKTDRPDLFEAIEKESFETGVNEGIKKERERTCSILQKASSFKDMNGLVYESIENGSTIEQATISFQNKQLENLQNASVENVGPDSDDSSSHENLSHIEKAKSYKTENNCSMTEALQATAPVRK